MPGATYLQIGDVSALTGILPGRIRHYESQRLIAPGHLESGYRTFSVDDVLRLLHIDLLRSLGMGLGDIRASVGSDPVGLRDALERHRDALTAQQRRLELLMGAVDQALAEPDGDPQAIVIRLAVAHRQSLGVFGRLERPLSTEAAETYRRLFGAWDLPVPGLFGQMLLPEPVTELLERLACTAGHELLFDRLRGLAERVIAVVIAGDAAAAEALGVEWVVEELAAPHSALIADVLRETFPKLRDLPVARSGFVAWAESMSPLAARVLVTIEAEARRHHAEVLGAIVMPAKGSAAGEGSQGDARTRCRG